MRIAVFVRTAMLAATSLCFAAAAGAAPADAAKVMTELGFPADTIAQVKAGEMVKTDLESSNERELAVGLAFLVEEKPSEFAQELAGGLLMEVDPNIEAHGALTGAGSLDQLAGLELGDLADAYSNAEAGDDLNLSAAEIEALKGTPASAIQQEVHKLLLAR